MSVKIHSAEIKDFKNVTSAAFQANENHIILTGTNGSGKTSILEALLTALCGKSVLPDDPIRHGAESAQIKLQLSENNTITYTISVNIRENDFVLKVNPYGPDGLLLNEIKKPQEFLKSIINKMAINPQGFFSLKPHEQVQELYKIMPELEDKIIENKQAFEACQQKRSEVMLQKKSIEGQLKTLPDISSYPEEELNSEDLTIELVRINKHNGQKSILQAKAKEATNNVKSANNKMIFLEQITVDLCNQVVKLEEQIEKLRVQIKNKGDEYISLSKENETIANTEIAALKELKNFVEISDVEIKTKLFSCSNHNEKAKIRKRYIRLLQELNEAEDTSIHCLGEMKTLQSEKLSICRTAKMPLPGLAIGEDCLLFQPDDKAMPVDLNSLSTGQKWIVALALHAKLNPNCKILFIESLNDLDQENQTILYQKAAENGIQLVLHNTAQVSDNKTCEIIIKETASIGGW